METSYYKWCAIINTDCVSLATHKRSVGRSHTLNKVGACISRCYFFMRKHTASCCTPASQTTRILSINSFFFQIYSKPYFFPFTSFRKRNFIQQMKWNRYPSDETHFIKWNFCLKTWLFDLWKRKYPTNRWRQGPAEMGARPGGQCRSWRGCSPTRPQSRAGPSSRRTTGWPSPGWPRVGRRVCASAWPHGAHSWKINKWHYPFSL